MSLITYTDLVDLVARGVIEGVEPDRINAASVDVTLGDVIWIEDTRHARSIDLAAKQTPAMLRVEMDKDGFELGPFEFCLAQTREVFNLPDDIACEFRLKSSGARAGLDQALAVWCDPGWHGSVLTLELRNNLSAHRMVLKPGMKVGQMVFWRGEQVPEHKSYAVLGQYNHDRETQPSKGLR